MTQQLQKSVAMAVRHQDASCNKKPCQEAVPPVLCHHLWRAGGGRKQRFSPRRARSCASRNSQRVLEMPADEVAALGNTTEGVTQGDVRGAQCSTRTHVVTVSVPGAREGDAQQRARLGRPRRKFIEHCTHVARSLFPCLSLSQSKRTDQCARAMVW